MEVQILGVADYTIPLYGNRRCLPYGKLRVSDGKTVKTVKFGYDMNSNGKQIYPPFFTFMRKRYQIENNGSLHSPNYVIIQD